MRYLGWVVTLIGAYLLGSAPIGLLIVRLRTGQDIRRLHSGRTGGTNVARAAGFWAGLVTGIADILKGAGAVWLARATCGGLPWIESAAGVLAILGHNHSIFLLEREGGRLRLRGGAGGAATLGVVFAMWPPSALIMVPVTLLVLFGIGYASLTTISIGLMAIGILTWRAATSAGPWEYVAFALATGGLLVWALRPNIRRLIGGTERLIGWRARKQVTPEGDAEKEASHQNRS